RTSQLSVIYFAFKFACTLLIAIDCNWHNVAAYSAQEYICLHAQLASVTLLFLFSAFVPRGEMSVKQLKTVQNLKVELRPSPMDTCSIMECWFFAWITPLILRGYRKTLCK